MTMAQFDFNSYLAKLDPGTEYDTEKLSGGLVNLTVRATKVRKEVGLDSNSEVLQGNQSFHGHDSLILKYAPPFVAAVGDIAPLSPFRQTIEARALGLLASTSEILSAQAASRVSVPRVLLHDAENHVLIMTDLGTGLLTLDQWLVPALSDSMPHSQGPPPDADACRGVGMRVGQFLAAIHNMDISSIDSGRFVNADTRRLVKELVINKMGEVFECFGYTGVQAQGWCATITKEFEAGCNCAGQGVFSMGDLWTGSILVSPDGSTVGLVDWEFAGEARPLQDVAQLCCHIRSLLMSLPSSSTSKPSITAFTHALQTTYRAHTRAANPSWFRDPTSRDAAIKAAWILHGREMVYNAGERYHGVCVALGAEEGEAEEKVRCMVQCGIGYLCGPQEGNLVGKWNRESFLTMFCLEEGDL